MLAWIILLLVLALAAGILGFGGVLTIASADIAKMLFAVFLAMLLASLLIGALRNRAP